MVLGLGLFAGLAEIGAAGTHGQRASLVLDDVGRRRLAERAHLGAVFADEAGHGRDGSGEHPLSSFARNRALLDTVECLLAHDHDIRAGDELHGDGIRHTTGLEHGLPGLENDVLVLHWRHAAIETQSAQRHASVSASGAAKRGEIIGAVAVRPALGVMDEIDEALIHCCFTGSKKNSRRILTRIRGFFFR